MPHDTALIATIVMGLVLAFALGFAASKMRLPPLVGYLLAGIAVGPFTPGFVADSGLAGQLAEIGVILLMFGVGLHFSLGDLIAVRHIALPGALVQIATATAIGAGLAHFLGWEMAEGLVFGLALSVASTVVLLRALGQRNILDTDKGRIAVGWLIVEDLAMILALVFLPVVSSAMDYDAQAGTSITELAMILLLTIGKVALFVVLVLSIGRRVIPRFLSAVARSGSRELFTLSVLALALGIAFAAVELFGVSFALGAFFAGVVLNESDLSHQAAAEMLPLQDAFAVLFFVSVGMLFDPTILVREPWLVLAVLFIIVIGKSLAAFAIVIAFRHPVSTALTISASLAQIGEFSFILANLGVYLGLLRPVGQDLILAGALLSITLNPFVFKTTDWLAGWLERRGAAKSGREEARLPAHPAVTDQAGRPLAGHAVLVGGGRVGESLVRALETWELPHVVIEHDLRRAEELRERGTIVLYGDATAPGILAAAGIASARLVIITVADSYHVQRALALSRTINPEIDSVVRTHSDAELVRLEEAGAGLAVFAERELALGMMGYALRSMGLSEGEAWVFVQSSRRASDTGMPPSVEPYLPAPELRRHRAE